MPGLYARINVEADGNILTAANYNSEHDNHITNAVPSQHDDYSTNVTQMQSTSDPGEVGTESLATSQAGEFERLRFAIKEIKGTNQWYESAATDLATISSPAGGLHIGLEFEGALGGASSTTDVLAKLINQGTIINALSWSTADVATGDFDSTNKKFGAYSYSLGAGNLLAFPGKFGNPVKGSISAWYRNLAAGDYIAYNPLLGIELFLDGVSGRQTLKVTEKTAATESTKTTNQVQGSATRSGDTTFAHVSAKFRLNDENGASTDLIELERNGVDEGTQLTGQDLDINAGNGGVWFFGARRNEPATWDHFYAASGLPTAHSAVWTSNGTPNASVSNGVLNIATSGDTTGFFSRTGAPLTGVNLANQTLEFKVRLNSSAQRQAADSPMCSVLIRDDSMDRGFYIFLLKNSIAMRYTNGTSVIFEMQLDTSQYHIYRLTTSGATNPIPTLYVDGVKVFVGTANTTADPSANDTIEWGDNDTTGSLNASNSDWEWLGYADEIAAPVAVSTQGQLDSIGITSSVITNTAITRLQSSKVTDVFNSVPSYGPTLPPVMVFDRGGTLSSSSTTFVAIGDYVYYLAGDGVTEFEINSLFSVSHSAAAGAGIRTGVDIDVDMIGSTDSFEGGGTLLNPSDINFAYPMPASRTIVLSPGLHIAKPIWLLGSGTMSVTTELQSVWSRRIAKEGRLA